MILIELHSQGTSLHVNYFQHTAIDLSACMEKNKKCNNVPALLIAKVSEKQTSTNWQATVTIFCAKMYI